MHLSARSLISPALFAAAAGILFTGQAQTQEVKLNPRDPLIEQLVDVIIARDQEHEAALPGEFEERADGHPNPNPAPAAPAFAVPGNDPGPKLGIPKGGEPKCAAFVASFEPNPDPENQNRKNILSITKGLEMLGCSTRTAFAWSLPDPQNPAQPLLGPIPDVEMPPDAAQQAVLDEWQRRGEAYRAVFARSFELFKRDLSSKPRNIVIYVNGHGTARIPFVAEESRYGYWTTPHGQTSVGRYEVLSNLFHHLRTLRRLPEGISMPRHLILVDDSAHGSWSIPLFHDQSEKLTGLPAYSNIIVSSASPRSGGSARWLEQQAEFLTVLETARLSDRRQPEIAFSLPVKLIESGSGKATYEQFAVFQPIDPIKLFGDPQAAPPLR